MTSKAWSRFQPLIIIPMLIFWLRNMIHTVIQKVLTLIPWFRRRFQNYIMVLDCIYGEAGWLIQVWRTLKKRWTWIQRWKLSASSLFPSITCFSRKITLPPKNMILRWHFTKITGLLYHREKRRLINIFMLIWWMILHRCFSKSNFTIVRFIIPCSGNWLRSLQITRTKSMRAYEYLRKIVRSKATETA